MNNTAIIAAAARRTPIGSMLGALSAVQATELGAWAIRACLNDAAGQAEHVGEVLMGCVLPAGLGQAPARQAALAAGIHAGAPCATQQQDDFATASVERALESAAAFAREITPVRHNHRGNSVEVREDEEPGRCDLSRIPSMRPAFASGGTVTAASSSSISDGAAALLLLSAGRAKELGMPAMARIVAHAAHAQAPEWFTTAPGPAIAKCLDKAGWKTSDVDLFEINEAFACVTMATMRDLDLPHKKVNTRGGACALGHPIGASGARLLVTLIHALQDRGGGRGVAALCIGGGEAVAVAVETP